MLNRTRAPLRTALQFQMQRPDVGRRGAAASADYFGAGAPPSQGAGHELCDTIFISLETPAQVVMGVPSAVRV